jgi:MYXO-CTERM domain-containing protein
MVRDAAAALTAIGCLVFPAVALATPNFPPEISAHLSLTYTPDCPVCHRGTPGTGTATSPFAQSMKARGLVANDIGSLDTALDALAAEGTDSDGDGVGDIAELTAGTDPNIAGGANLTPVYGCGARIAPVAAAGPWALLLALPALGMLALRRRRA